MKNDILNSNTETYQEGSVAEVFHLLELVGKKLRQIQRQNIREMDLTPPQYYILTTLWKKDGLPFYELADGCQCTRATITGIVDTLEKKGLVFRETNPKDRRSLLVKLTPKGKSLKGSTPTLDRIFRGCCGGLRHEETKRLSQLLKKLDDSLSM